MINNLSDGLAFTTLSMPLPADHWLTASGHEAPPMPFRMGTTDPRRQEYNERVSAAARFAIRAATMNGAKNNFDPDALVQNFIVGMLGYHTPDGLSRDPDCPDFDPYPVPPHFPPEATGGNAIPEAETTTKSGHVLYETGDPDAPDVILDSNGEVALGMCKICGAGESELEKPCLGEIADTMDALWPDLAEFAKRIRYSVRTADSLRRQRDEANHQVSELSRELVAISQALATTRFMDPPDGGAPSLAEQVTRMRGALEDAERRLAANDDYPRALAEITRLKGVVSTLFRRVCDARDVLNKEVIPDNITK